MSYMTDDEMELPRRRQASEEALAGREAARFVRDLNRQLGTWQAQSVKLHIMAERASAAGQANETVATEALRLLRMVCAEKEQFERQLPELSEAASRHGRIADTRRSFEMVATRLRDCLGKLGCGDGVSAGDTHS